MQAKSPLLVTLGVVLGIIFLITAYVYFSREAQNLPSFFPGHTAGLTTVHTKHGIAALLLAVASFVAAWFQSGPKKVSE